MQNDFLQSERFRELKQRHRVLMKELAGLDWLTLKAGMEKHRRWRKELLW
jgi:hypothetical protein